MLKTLMSVLFLFTIGCSAYIKEADVPPYKKEMHTDGSYTKIYNNGSLENCKDDICYRCKTQNLLKERLSDSSWVFSYLLPDGKGVSKKEYYKPNTILVVLVNMSRPKMIWLR